ncbi:MAG: single-stranded DNA-binding protein [Ilumatobacteraceae bacterium]|jgi:single-strand DNA-binding protein
MNIVILQGQVRSDPRCSELPTGDQRWAFDIATPDVDGRSMSVPVSCAGPSRLASLVAGLAVGDDVVVEGSVRRRFFRSGGATQSRTEVVAIDLVPARSRARVRRLLQRGADALSDAAT